MLETITVSTRQTLFFRRLKKPRTGKPPSAFLKRRSLCCYSLFSFAQRKLVEPSIGTLRPVQVPFVPLPPEWVTCVSLCLDLSNKLLAEAKGRLGWISMTGHWELPSLLSPLGSYWRGLPQKAAGSHSSLFDWLLQMWSLHSYWPEKTLILG